MPRCVPRSYRRYPEPTLPQPKTEMLVLCPPVCDDEVANEPVKSEAPREKFKGKGKGSSLTQRLGIAKEMEEFHLFERAEDTHMILYSPTPKQIFSVHRRNFGS